MIKIRLESDWVELYDAWFDNDGIVFRRFSTDGPNRVEMINILKGAGIKTPIFGKYQDFKRWNYPENSYVVVYKDIYRHCGNGKERKVFGSLTEEEKHYYMMEYIDTATEEFFSKSTRILCIGNNIAYTYDYMSIEDWRSNCGEGDVTDARQIEIPYWRKDLKYPLLAIDFVNNKAVDLNISPGIKGVRFLPYISPSKITESIKQWFSEHVQ